MALMEKPPKIVVVIMTPGLSVFLYLKMIFLSPMVRV
jgi:hypothetical protein